MNCRVCSRENQSDARFCSGCGNSLILSCKHCDRELAADSRFCDGCGQAVGGLASTTPAISAAAVPGQPQAAARKTVTALFCDLVGSTAFGEQVDAESSRDAMGRYFEMARSVVEAHGGTVAKFVGDGLLALFGVPEMAEDDAERSVHCGLVLQVKFDQIRRHIEKRYGIAVGLRVGINTGEVVIADEDEDIVGDALNTAARLEAACTPGRVLVGEATWRLTRSVLNFGDRREIRAKGKEELVGCYEVVDAHAIEEVTTPFVGREAELRQLRMVLEDTILDRTAKMVTVVGSPGVGKTRLAREMRAAVDGGTMAFELRCERSGGTTFAPISELMRSVAGITDAHNVSEIGALVAASVADLHDSARVSELLAGFVGAAPMRSTEEMFFAVRRLFELMGATQPVVFVIDDIQWAEPLFLDLLEHLVEWVRTVPLLIVGLARPEIRELRPVLAEAGRRVAAVVNLEGLSEQATTELATKLVGAESLPRDLLAKIPESTEGNPLFVRELMRMLVDDGVISDASGSWQMVIDIDAVEVPTINSLLASRVERMAPDERRLLELASVVGSEFPVGAVEAAGAEQSRGELESLFERLRRRELIEPTGSYWGDEPVFRFHHVLIRDAAYRRLLKGARAELHVLIGEWTENTARTLVGEHEVVIAHHFEQAHHYRHQLDLDDYETRALGERAASLLHIAATRALNREDLEAAGSLATRALACVDDQSSDIAELLVLACEALLGTRNVAAGAPLVDRLDEVAGSDARLGGWVECFRAELAIVTDPDGLHDAELRAEAAAGLLEDLGDQAGVAKARLQRAAALARLGRVGECEEELDLALTAARAIDDRRRVTAILGTAPVAALWGPSPVPRAGGRCLDVVRLLRITTGSPAVEATSVRCQAVLEALRGRYDTARTMLATARNVLEELGQSHGLLETELYSGLVELLAQDAVAAEPFLRRAYDGLGSMGIGADAGQAAAHLARALLLQDRIDEADDLAAESNALAGQNPQTAIISHSVQAEVLAGRGRFDEAIVIAEEAVALGARTDILVDHANAVASLARVLGAAGHPDQAARTALEAARLFEKKGATTVTPSIIGVGAISEPSIDGGEIQPRAPEHAARFWNKAHEWALAHLRAFVDRDEAGYSALVDDDVVLDDQRSLVQLQLHGKHDVVGSVFFPGSSDLAPNELKLSTPVAVRGELLALMSTTIGLQGESVELGWFGITQWSDDGLLRRLVLFDTDDLVDALAELDRLHQAVLAPAELLFYSELSDYNASHAARDLDGAMSRFDSSLVMIDHRRLGWPKAESGAAQMGQRIEGLHDVADSVVSVAEQVHRRTFAGLVMSHRFDVVMPDKSAPSQASILVSMANPASGHVTRVEQFDERDLVGALARFDHLMAELGPLESSGAVQVGGNVNVCVRSGRRKLLSSFVCPGFVLEDSEGNAIAGDLIESLRSVGFGGHDRTVVAVRCDRIALIDVGLDDGTRRFLVEEIDDQGLLVRIRQFRPEQLREAFHHLEQRWIDIDSSIPAALVDPIRRFVSAAQDAGPEFVRVLHEDFESIDHRVLGMRTLDRSEFIGSLTSADALAYCPVEQIIHRTTNRGFVAARFVALVGEPLREVLKNPHLLVVLFDGGSVRRMEWFPEDQLDVALACLDADEGAASEVGQELNFWNKAHESANRLLTIFVARDEAAYRSMIADDVVMDDRRSLVRLRLDGKQDVVDAAFFAGSSELGVGVVRSSDPIAVRGESLALNSTVVSFLDESVELVWLAVTQWSSEGLLRRMVTFNPDDLAAALAELDRLHELEGKPSLATLPIDLSLDLVNSASRLIEERWADSGSVEMLAVRFDDHALAEVTSESGSFFVLLSVPTDGNEPDEQCFDADSLPEAMRTLIRRWIDGLGSEATAGLPTFAALLAAMNPPDPDALAAVYSPGFRNIENASLLQLAEAATPADRVDVSVELFTDSDNISAKVHRLIDHLVLSSFVISNRRPDGGRWTTRILAISREAGGKVDYGETWDADDMHLADARFDELALELLEATLSSEDQSRRHELSNDASTAFGRASDGEYFVVAVRDRLALVDVAVTAMSRNYVVVEVDQSGEAVLQTEFEATDINGAMECLDARWSDLSTESNPKSRQLLNEFASALRQGDQETLATLIHGDFVVDDHRLLGLGTLGREDWLAVHRGNREIGTFLSRQIYRLTDAGLVASTALVSGHQGDDLIEAGVSIAVAMFADGLLWRMEYFPEDQVDAALLRFDELAERGLPATTIAEAADLSPDLINAAATLIEERWSAAGSVEVLAVRFDAHALAQVTTGSESFFVVLTTTLGNEPDERRFGIDDLSDAMRLLDRRFIDGLGDAATVGLETFAAAIAAVNPPDPDVMAALYSPEMSYVNHAYLNQLASDVPQSELIDITVDVNTDVDSIIAKVSRLSDHLILAIFTFSNRRTDGERWTSSQAVLSREANGRVELQESWDVEDIAAANVRFDELAAELANEAIAVPVRSLEIANAATARFELERPDDDFEIVAVLDQGHALVELLDSGSSDFVSVVLAPSGELTTLSFADRLADGMEGFYRAWVGTLDENERTTALLFAEFGLAHHPPVDADRMTALLSSDFELVAHNQMGALDNATASQKVTALVKAGDALGIVVSRKVLAHSEHVALLNMEETHQFPGTDRWGTRLLVLVVERDGLVAFQEQWDVRDLNVALARFDELATATEVPEAADPLAFRMTTLRSLSLDLQKLRRSETLDASQLDDFFDDEVVFDDRRSLVSAGRLVGKSAVVELTLATHAVGLADDDNETIALRGDSHVLGRSDLVDETGNLIERLLLVSLGTSGKIACLVTFDSDAIDAAYDELDRLYRESLSAELQERFDQQMRVTEALVTGDVAATRELFAKEFLCTDHRLQGSDEALDLDAFAEGVRLRPLTLGPGTYRLHDHEFFGTEVAVTNVTVVTTTPEFGVEASETTWSVVKWVHGQAVSHEVYNPDQREEAFARSRYLCPKWRF